MDLEQVEQYVIQRMERELSPDLFYHGLFHTRDDVVPAVKRLAEMEGVGGEALTILLTAAWFHDIGYIVQPNYHEFLGIRIAQEVLPGLHYSDEQIEVIRWAIMATILPQAPQTPLEAILVDADLDVLGRGDFWPRNHDLRQELACLGKQFSDESWFTNQLKFIETHHYFTASAHALRDAQKTINIAEMRKALQSLTP